MKPLTVDDVINVTGQFGRSQKIFILGIIPLHFFLAAHMLLNIFTGLEPTFLCFPGDEDAKFTATRNKNESLLNQCIDNDAHKCRIVYTSQYKSFAVEWNLICSEKYKVALVQSVWMFGVMSGALMLGRLADIIGRLKTLMLALLGTIAFEGFSAFAPSYTIMVVFRYLGGVCCSLIIVASFVLCQELVGMDWRSFVGILISMCFALGIAIFSTVAAAVDDWRTLTFICSISGILCLSITCCIPESPRWLASQGRNGEAKAILEDIAKKNLTLSKLPKQWCLPSVTTDKEKKKAKGIGLLVSHPYITIITLILITSWFVNSVTYYGLTLAASDLGGNVYVSTALNGLVEIPAGFITMCIIDSAEIFPTVIRNSGMGIVSVFARIGGMLAPFILMLGDVRPNLQYTALGLMAILSGLLNLKLPETLGQPMPETISDVLALRNLSKPFGHSKYKKLETEDTEANQETMSRTPSPSVTGKSVCDDQVPLMEDM